MPTTTNPSGSYPADADRFDEDFNFFADEEQRSRGGNGAGEPLPKLVPIRFVKGELIPPREWIVYDGWIPSRKVTLLQGDGAVGKTLLMQQLQSSCATELPWIGLRVEPLISVGVYTEDEERDLKLQQAAIDAAYGQACAETGNMLMFPRPDDENELVVFDRSGKPTLTKFYHQVRETALDVRARLVVLDVAVDLFGGDEINRRNVRAFMRPLGSLAREIDGATVLSGHVSQAGLRSDGGHSSSTDWSNSGRSRLYLNRPSQKTEDDEIDGDARLFTRKKANYASVGDTIKLHWRNGVFVPDALSTPSYFRRPADEVFLALLDEQTATNRTVSENTKAGNYASSASRVRLRVLLSRDGKRGNWECLRHRHCPPLTRHSAPLPRRSGAARAG